MSRSRSGFVSFTAFCAGSAAFAAASTQVSAAPPVSTAPVLTYEDATSQAKQLFRRLTGVPISATDPRLDSMASLIKKGHPSEAAAIATEDPNFYQVTVKNLAAELGSRSETPFMALDDFQATFIGTVRDGLDARGLLTGDYVYKAELIPGSSLNVEPSRRDNQHYEKIDQNHLEYKTSLWKQEPQWVGPEAMKNHAGLMTTRAWGWNYDAGTNRRAVVNSFDRFLCRPISAWKVPYLDESTIARDVDRYPGKNPKVFQEQCRSCHGSQDPMRDAFSSLDFFRDTLVELPPGRPAPKYSRGLTTYPQGHVTTDDHWFNPIAPFKPELGFKPELTSGQGVNAYGEMLANSQAFNSCMATRVFSSVCQRSPRSKDSASIQALASSFDKNGHNLKKLFQETASSPVCLQEVGIKNFNALNRSLSKVTGLLPTKEIDDYYKSVMTRLPKDGRVDEVNPSMLIAEKALAALYCKEFSKANSDLATMTSEALLTYLSRRIYGRVLAEGESKRMLDAMKSSRHDPVFIPCTVMTSSLEFLVQ